MGFFRRVARDVARDIQVIITGEGGSSKKKRQRYDPKKRRAKKRYVPRKKGSFLTKMRGKYGDRAKSLNTETQRDFADELRHLSFQALGRMLRTAYRNGDDGKAHAIEREIDRRQKGAMLSRYSRRK